MIRGDRDYYQTMRAVFGPMLRSYDNQKQAEKTGQIRIRDARTVREIADALIDVAPTLLPVPALVKTPSPQMDRLIETALDQIKKIDRGLPRFNT